MVPATIGYILDVVALSYWFMDDGYAWSFESATECFTLAEVKLLAAALQANFGQHNSTIPRRPPSVDPERVSRRLRSPCSAPPATLFPLQPLFP